MLFILLCTFKFCNYLEEEEKDRCFAIIVLQDNHLANMAWWLKSAGALNFEL